MDVYKTRKGQLHTHTSLDGGLYNVELDKYDDFLSQYIQVYKQKKKLYLSERIPKGKTFRFFMDLDFLLSQHDTPSVLRKFYRQVHASIVQVLADVTTNVKLSVRLRKVHVHCPDLIVNLESVLLVFEKVKAQLEKDFPDEDSAKIYDKSVYKSGLRMLGSLKPTKSDKDPRWVTTKEYSLLDEDFEPLSLSSDDDLEDKISWLRDASVFNLDSKPLTVIPWENNQTQNYSRKRSIKSSQTSKSDESTKHQITSDIPEGSRKVLEKFILSYYHHQPPRILRIERRVENDTAYLLVELDELYCPFVERCHKSNRQYITISEHRAVQKCHDEFCKDKHHEELRFEDMTATVRKAITECCSPGKELDPELVKAAEDEAKQNLGNHIPEDQLPLSMTLQPDAKSILGDLQKHSGLFQDHLNCSGPVIADTNIDGLVVRCTKCAYRWPKGDHRMSVSKQYVNLNKVLVIINNLTVNNNVTVNNNYGGDNADLDVSFDKMYSIFDDEELNALCYRALDGTSTHLAELLYYLAKNRFAHGEDKKEPWFEFVQPRWVIRKHGIFDLIPNILIEKLKIIKDYYTQFRPDGELTSKQISKINNIIKAILRNEKHVIETDAAPKFARKNFIQDLDSKRTVLGFDDGVYDFETKSFREGYVDDYISLNIGYDFPKESNSEIRKEIFRFFEDIQPELSERKYLLTFLATLIHGDNKEETFHIFTGTTRNGKSLLSDLLKATLGDYYTSFAANMLTKERPPPSQPQPDILYLKSKRVAIGSEPENGQKINSGYMKYITGNDTITARGLYENTITEFKPQFKLVLLCNVIPLMDSNDLGVWSRSRIVNFPTTFVDEPRLPHEKKIDRTLKSRVQTWGPEFMLMLIQIYHEEYEVHGLIPTPVVLQKTQEYQEESDIVMRYMTENIIRSERGINLSLSHLYEQFIVWSKTNSPGEKIISNREFNKELRRLNWDVKYVKVNDTTLLGIQNIKFINNC